MDSKINEKLLQIKKNLKNQNITFLLKQINESNIDRYIFNYKNLLELLNMMKEYGVDDIKNNYNNIIL